MAAVRETVLSLRIMGDDLDPDEITKLLGGKPVEAHRKGDTIVNSRGLSRTTKSGGWRRRANVSGTADLDGQVREVFAGLTEDTRIWRGLSARYRIDIFCGLFLDGSNEGIELSPETMMMLGSRGIVIGFDIYSGASPKPRP